MAISAKILLIIMIKKKTMRKMITGEGNECGVENYNNGEDSRIYGERARTQLMGTPVNDNEGS